MGERRERNERLAARNVWDKGKERGTRRGGGGGWRGGNERAAMDKSKRAPLEHMKRTCGLNE